MRRPESLLLIMAIMASIGMHMPPYLGLGALSDYFKEQEKLHKQEELPPVSIDVVSQPQPEEVKPQPPPPPPVAKKEKPKPKKKEEEKKKPEQVAQKEPEKPKPELAVKEQPKPEQPPPPPPAERKQSITQKSQDPNVQPPPNARFMAEESQLVPEESIASITSETRDDPKPKAAAPMSAAQEHAGDSHEDEKGAMHGAQEEQQQQAAAQQRQPTNEPPPAAGTNTPNPSLTPKQNTPAPRAEAPQETIIRDPLGTFVLAAQSPQRNSEQGGGGPQGAGGKAPSLKVSWRSFEEQFGAEQLAADRLPREAKRRGAGREKRWEDFRAAIENYVEGVKPGNTTALNAAADPFAAYLAAFHRNLHAEFAYSFVASLPMTGELANPMLVTKVEIVINPDGSLDRVGVVKSSGNMMYDFGAFNAVQRGSPYPATPEKIRSPDGRVYMRWALHRDQNMCGTWLAEPYILKTAPRSPNDPPQDNISPFLPGRAPSNPNGEHGSNHPSKEGGPNNAPAVAPGETLGQRSFRVRRAG